MPERTKHFRFEPIELARVAWVEYQRDRAKYLALAMIYYGIVSLVPILSLLLSTLGLLLRFSPAAAEAEQKIMIALDANLGAPILAEVKLLVETLEQQSAIGALISIAALFLSASVLFRHLRLSFRAIWKYEPPLVSGPVLVVARTVALEKIISVVMVLLISGIVIVSLSLTIAIQWTDRVLSLFNLRAAWALGALASFILYAITFALLLKFLPPVSVRLRVIWPVALLCAFVWVFASELLAIFSAFFGYERSAYGAIAGILAALLWINIGSQALFFGAELCKVSARRAGEPLR